MTAFRDWLIETSASDLTVDIGQDGLRHEAQSNQWGFSFTQEQVGGLSPEEVMTFLNDVLDTYSARLAQLNHGSRMVFYSWFDAQASELRFSLVSASHGSLPFDCPIKTVSSPAQIVELLLDASHHGGIPLSEFVEHDCPVNEVPLEVWAKELPTYLLRPYALAKGEFVVPDDFNAPLPEDILRDFEGRGRP